MPPFTLVRDIKQAQVTSTKYALPYLPHGTTEQDLWRKQEYAPGVSL